MELVAKNWSEILAVLSLIVALVGGVPGIISVINYHRDKPILTFDLVTTMFGRMVMGDSDREYTNLVLTCTVSNHGTKPLSPAAFYLSIKVNDRWIEFESSLLSDEITYASDFQDIKLTNAEQSDLQRFNGSIALGMPLRGHLQFYSDKVPLESFFDGSRVVLRLTCLDIFGRLHKSDIQQTFNRPDEQGQEHTVAYPKHGVTVKPLKKDDSPLPP